MWIDPKYKPAGPHLTLAYVGNRCYAVPFKDDPVWKQWPAEAREAVFRQVDDGLAVVEGKRLVWASPYEPTYYPTAIPMERWGVPPL